MNKKLGIIIFSLHFILSSIIVLFGEGWDIIILIVLDFPFTILLSLGADSFIYADPTLKIVFNFFFFAVLGSLWWVYIVFTITSIFEGKKVKLK